MTDDRTYEVGDRVRVVHESGGAVCGAEGKVVSLCYDHTNAVVGLNILITSDPATTHGTTVFLQEVELIGTSS